MKKSNVIKEITTKIIDEINNYDNVFIFHHINPDGDCLGSQFGLKNWLKNLFPEKKIHAIGDNENLFNFIKWDFNNDYYDDQTLKNSIAIIVDGNYSDRINSKELFLKIPNKIRIDHHPENDDLDYIIRFVDDSYSSSAEQIAHLIYSFDKENLMTKEIATYLYIGIYTDSGRFFYDKTSSRTHQLTSWLFETNFDFDFIHKNLAKRKEKEIIFLKDVLNNYKTYKNVIYYFISWKKSQELNLEMSEKNRVDFLANIDTYNIWIFFIENEDKTVRVRLRSNEKNVNKLAKEYGGGGHIKASGAIIDSKDKIEELIKKASAL